MKLKRVLALILASVVGISAFSGCGKKEDGEIVLKYVMAGPAGQADADEVFKAVNDKIHEIYPNITLDIEVIASSDYKQKVLLMETGKEKLDIVNTYGLSFDEEVENGALIELDDLLDEYGKDIKKALPEWLFDYMRVDGKLYGIPSYQCLPAERGLVMQKEYADKWLDREALENELYSNDHITDKTIDILNDYLKTADENGQIHLGAFHFNELSTKGYEVVKGNFVADIKTHKVSYKFELPEVRNQYKYHAEWFENGWVRKDALSASDENQKKNTKEGYILYDAGYNPWTEEALKKTDGTDFVVIPFNDELFIPKDNAAGGTAISAACKNPEAAMQVINLLQTNKDIYNTLVYGIEGKHYTKEGENRIKTLYDASQASSSDKYGLYPWIVGNTSIKYLNQGTTDEAFDWEFNVANKSEWRSELIGLNINTEEISDSLAQLDAIKGEYMKTLATGALGDGWEDYYNEWMEKAKAAGLDEVRANIQKQVDEYVKNK